MKALEKDRTRRYETANGLARDIQRYLSDEPVEACPPSATYRLRKFAQEESGRVDDGGGHCAAPRALEWPSATWQAVRATRAEAVALQARTSAKRERAEGERARQARRPGEGKAGRRATRQGGESPRPHPRRARRHDVDGHRRFAQHAEGDQRRPEEVPDRGADVLPGVRGRKSGRRANPRPHREGGVSRWDDRGPAGSQGTSNRGVSNGSGRLPEAGRRLPRRACLSAGPGQQPQQPGDSAGRSGETSGGGGAVPPGLAIQEKLAADFPAVPDYRQELAGSHNNLGSLLADLGKRAEAEEQYRQALAIQEKLAADFPAVPDYRQDWPAATTTWGFCWPVWGNERRRRSSTARRWPSRRSWPPTSPPCPTIGRNWPSATTTWGFCWPDLGKRAEAEEQYRQALAIQEKLAADFPAVPDYRRELAVSHNNLGILLAGLGKRAEAEEQYRQALAIQEKLAADFPAVPDYRQELAGSHNNLGDLLAGLGKRAEAEEQYRQALAIQEKLAADFPAVPDYRRTGQQPQQPGGSAGRSGETSGGGGAVPQGAGHPGEAGRRLPRRARLSN